MLFAGVVVVSIADATLASPQHQGYPLRYMLTMFQSQTRRLLPRNHAERFDYAGQITVSIADATLASPQHGTWATGLEATISGFNRRRDACFPATRNEIVADAYKYGFNRRRDACFPATHFSDCVDRPRQVSIADATLASPQQGICSHPQNCLAKVSIADATLASPQRFFLG